MSREEVRMSIPHHPLVSFFNLQLAIRKINPYLGLEIRIEVNSKCRSCTWEEDGREPGENPSKVLASSPCISQISPWLPILPRPA